MKLLLKICGWVCSLVAIWLLAIYFDYDNSKAFEYIITFLSVAVGFNVTALSIIANSNFSARLYSLEDEKDNSKTLLHVLIGKFRKSISLFLITIVLILIFFFIEGDVKGAFHKEFTIMSNTFNTPKILKAIIWYFTIISSVKFTELIAVFSKFVIKSAPKS